MSFPERVRQFVQIEVSFPASGEQTEVRLPTWAPGSYQERSFAANLQWLEASDTSGESLNWSKREKDTWLVENKGRAFRVSYRVHAAQKSVSSSWVSDDYILLNGASLFLYTDASRHLPQDLTVKIGEGGETVATSLKAQAGPGHWIAGDYDELLDNPVLISDGVSERFELGGQAYHLFNAGDTRWWDMRKAAGDLKSIARAANALWKEVPLERDYWFLNVINGGTGGLEHDHSTVMQADRWTMTRKDEYLNWLSLSAHEYFHVWNIRRLRPEALALYDYRREQYTDSLWVAEGIASYYDDLLLSRARVIRPAEYLKRLALQIHSLEMTPGRQRLSLAEASREAWTRHYRPRPNSINDSVSYYRKGAVISFLLDSRIRRESKGKESLDDVLRHFWGRWKNEPYPEGAFLDSVAVIAGEQTRAWFRPMISEAGSVDAEIDEALEWYGLVINRAPAATVAELTGQPAPAGMAVNWDVDSDRLIIAAVIEGGPAAVAGLLPGDEVIAMDEVRVDRMGFDRQAQALGVGSEVVLLIARQSNIQRYRVTLSEARPGSYEILAPDVLSKRNIRRLEAWLGQPVITP